MLVWTFETLVKENGPINTRWRRSTQRFATPKDAAKAAATWMQVSAENGETVTVRLFQLEPEDADQTKPA